MAELYIKLKHYDRAERTLNVGLDHKEGKYYNIIIKMTCNRYVISVTIMLSL